MKLSRPMRYIAILISGAVLVTAFQNCGQPGSIAASSTESISSSPDPSGPNDPPNNPPPTTNPSYKDFSKDVSVAGASDKVDVLVVVDNSISMNYEQINMGERFDSFMDKLQGLDWQVGIVTTDLSGTNELKDGRLISYGSNKYLVTSKDGIAAAKTMFANTVKRDENGSGSEQGIRATRRALERALVASDRNAQLVRPGAALSVIVVTDADETPGKNTDAGDESKFGATNFASNLYSFVTASFPGKSFKFHSIIVKSGDVACLQDKSAFKNGRADDTNQNEGYGVQYEKMSALTGGIVGSVCAADYSDQLKIIGQSTADQVKAVTLDCAPVDSDKDGKVDLTVRNIANNAVLSDYTVTGSQVNFTQPLAVANYRFVYRCLVK